jgi:hypothetical protein
MVWHKQSHVTNISQVFFSLRRNFLINQKKKKIQIILKI